MDDSEKFRSRDEVIKEVGYTQHRIRDKRIIEKEQGYLKELSKEMSLGYDKRAKQYLVRIPREIIEALGIARGDEWEDVKDKKPKILFHLEGSSPYEKKPPKVTFTLIYKNGTNT